MDRVMHLLAAVLKISVHAPPVGEPAVQGAGPADFHVFFFLSQLLDTRARKGLVSLWLLPRAASVSMSNVS